VDLVLPQMGLVPDEGAAQQFVSASLIQHSVMALMRGVRTPQSTPGYPSSGFGPGLNSARIAGGQS
jgi:hypothetical protein